MVDQAQEQSTEELSIEDRFAALEAPEVPEEEEEQPAPQDNEEEATEAEDDGTPEEEQAETEEEEAEPDLVEIDVDGELYKVPEALKDKIMLQADYTRKTQEVAEQRKQVEQAGQQLQQQAQIQQQNLAEYAQLMALDGQLQSYQSTDWNALYDQDPAEFVRLKEAYRELKDSRTDLVNNLTVKQQQQMQEQQNNLAKTIQTNVEILKRDIPNWSGELYNTLMKHVVDKYGITEQEAAGITDARSWKIAHKAYLYDQLQAGKAATTKKVTNLPKPTKPGGLTNKNANQQAQESLHKRLKKTGSMEDATALFFERYK